MTLLATLMPKLSLDGKLGGGDFFGFFGDLVSFDIFGAFVISLGDLVPKIGLLGTLVEVIGDFVLSLGALGLFVIFGDLETFGDLLLLIGEFVILGDFVPLLGDFELLFGDFVFGIFVCFGDFVDGDLVDFGIFETLNGFLFSLFGGAGALVTFFTLIFIAFRMVDGLFFNR